MYSTTPDQKFLLQTRNLVVNHRNRVPALTDAPFQQDTQTISWWTDEPSFRQPPSLSVDLTFSSYRHVKVSPSMCHVHTENPPALVLTAPSFRLTASSLHCYLKPLVPVCFPSFFLTGFSLVTCQDPRGEMVDICVYI